MKQKNSILTCKITTPEETSVIENVESIRLPAFSGQMQILPGHAESFILLKKGPVSVKKGNGEVETIEADEGQCHVKDDEVVIIL